MEYLPPKPPETRPNLGRVDSLVRQTFDRYRSTGERVTPWLVSQEVTDFHPSTNPHLQIEFVNIDWKVTVVERGLLGDGSQLFTDILLFAKQNSVFSVQQKSIWFDKAFPHLESDDVDNTEGLQDLHTLLSAYPVITKQRALEDWRMEEGFLSEAKRAKIEKERRLLETGTFIARVLERIYLHVDPNFAYYGEKR